MTKTLKNILPSVQPKFIKMILCITNKKNHKHVHLKHSKFHLYPSSTSSKFTGAPLNEVNNEESKQ